MGSDLVYPDSLELRLIEMDKLPGLQAARRIFDIMKIVETDDAVIAWEQEDNYVGLQKLRGINGAPTRVKRTGAKRFLTQPGIYGEFTELDEQELLRRRAFGTLDQPINVTDMVMKEQDRLLGRRLDRIELIGWTLLSTGTFSVALPTGGIAHTDSYDPQEFSTIVPWSTHETSTPHQDFRNVKLKARGHSVRFDGTSDAYLNTRTLNDLLANTNPADLYGRRVAGLQTINSPTQLAQLFQMDGLPRLNEYDDGYLDENGDFHTFIPDGVVVLKGVRTTGANICEYKMTRNVNNPSFEAGAYTRVIDRGDTQIPRSVEVHDGHNGGPTMLYPSAVVIMDVAHTGA